MPARKKSVDRGTKNIILSKGRNFEKRSGYNIRLIGWIRRMNYCFLAVMARVGRVMVVNRRQAHLLIDAPFD